MRKRTNMPTPLTKLQKRAIAHLWIADMLHGTGMDSFDPYMGLTVDEQVEIVGLVHDWADNFLRLRPAITSLDKIIEYVRGLERP